ncbi:hypothetical protein FHQ28_05605 [Pasteurellaceae bacterium USgator11]|nr:hypothetical protein FHQ20_07865 [Pasteurellaceae bacterium USgator41]TNG96472.1 hypothetical protein FHQ19_02040 [Pasteurellaceae bacterium UScroc12]TNH00446.1 hypothetical protein FHQ24_03585 [Pasteurellaceae bacterium UScroc31]TNH01723.1 hypothetical protein FHQ28_05605 [Pasteurellaceae bacterium USgator11]
MQYYLVFPDSEKRMIVRGNDDFLSFEQYDHKSGMWSSKNNFYWADKILVSDFVDFEEISEAQAKELISVN